MKEEEESYLWRDGAGNSGLRNHLRSGEQGEKSNHNLKGLAWRGAIYQRMRLKAFSFFLSSYSLPLGLRVVEAERRRKKKSRFKNISVGGFKLLYCCVH